MARETSNTFSPYGIAGALKSPVDASSAMFKQKRMSHYANKGDLTTGSVRGHLVRLTLPMVTGLFAIISFQLVNTFYISRLGTQELAAISFTFPVTYIIFSLFLGFGIAIASVISRLIGERTLEDVKRITSHTLVMVFILGLILSFVGILFLNPIFTLLGADETMLALIRDYMPIYFSGLFFISLPVVINAGLRAQGDTFTPALIMVCAAIANAIIDPILIFGLFGFPRLELQGAAISTLVSNIAACLAGFYIMYKRGLIATRYLSDFSAFKNSLQRILFIALPVGLTSGLPSLVNSVILHLLSYTGAAAVAAFGVVSRVEAFCFIIMMALASGMAPVIGQNYGARNTVRVRDTIKQAVLFCVGWSIFVAIILGVFAHFFADIFSDNQDVRNYIVLYFLVVPFSYAASNLVNGWASAFNAMGKPEYGAGILFLKMLVLLIPALYFGHYLWGVGGLFVAIALVNIVTGIAVQIFGWKYVSAPDLGK